MDKWPRAHWNSRRHVYLLALILPAFSLLDWLRNPYYLYRLEEWAWFALAPICLLQFFRPTFLGWALVEVEYTWSVLRQIEVHIGAFQDIGSEDHSRWEGWNSELGLLGFTAWLIVIIVLVTIHRPKRVAHAT